jgi:hypothetical protein
MAEVHRLEEEGNIREAAALLLKARAVVASR